MNKKTKLAILTKMFHDINANPNNAAQIVRAYQEQFPDIINETYEELSATRNINEEKIKLKI